MHPLGRNAPDRKGCSAYRSGAAHTDRVQRIPIGCSVTANKRDRARAHESGGALTRRFQAGLPSQESEGRNRDRGDAWGQRRYAATTQLPEAAADGPVSALVTSLSTPRNAASASRKKPLGRRPRERPVEGRAQRSRQAISSPTCRARLDAVCACPRAPTRIPPGEPTITFWPPGVTVISSAARTPCASSPRCSPARAHHARVEPARTTPTLKQQAWDSTAYFHHPHTTSDPTQAINGRLEHLRSIT